MYAAHGIRTELFPQESAVRSTGVVALDPAAKSPW